MAELVLSRETRDRLSALSCDQFKVANAQEAVTSAPPLIHPTEMLGELRANVVY